MQIGVIADTHSKMRPEALEAIAGHSRKPRNEWIDDVLYFNPGGAGPRRFTLPITVGRLQVSDNGVVGEIIELPV
jgi:predicted phosphodiesterase